MKKREWILFLSLFFMIASSAFAQQSETNAEDKTLSPYFFVKSDDPNLDQLPLKSTSAEVNIAGVIADVKVTQVYKNEGKKAIEAIYVFPASTRASVYGMKMTIGERTIIAKVRERETARQEYEAAKQAGKSASLLEQQRPNLFQMNVANILPGDEIKVELSYTELLIPEEGIYEFVYPTVVGPRYSNLPEADAPQSENWVQNPYLHQGEAPPYTFDINVNLSGSMPIQKITCTSHNVNINYQGDTFATIKLKPYDKTGGNKDYILKYQLAGGKIESGLLLYSGEKENFFLLMMQPPERIKNAHIPPREYVFIVDVSGSMHGFPLDISKRLLKDLIQNLRQSDKFNVLLFAGGSQLLSEKSLPATSENIRQAIRFIENQRGGGGTELLPALNRALSLTGTENYSRSMIIATDGYVRVEKEAFDLIRKNLGSANMFTFGIGSSVNRFLIEGMARVGMGEPFVITKPNEASEKADRFREYIQYPVLTRARTDFGRFDVYDVEPLGIPDLLANRPVILFGKWRGKPKGKIRLTGISGERQYSATVDVSKVKPLEANAALKYLWARHKIALLSDYNKLSKDDARVREITQLGLTYNLLTEYTSFVAIDSMVRRKDGDVTTIKQPLPLPEGVSDYAVQTRGGYAKGRTSPLLSASPPPTNSRKISKKLAEPKAMPKPEAIAEPEPEEELEFEPMAEPEPLIEPEPEPQEIIRGDKKVADKEEANEITPGKGTVSLIPDKTEIKGDLRENYLRNLIKNHLAEIEACYQIALQKDPGIKGKVSIIIEIDVNGKVSDVKITPIADEDLKACITKQVKTWLFPIPGDGKEGMVKYELLFSVK